MKQFYIIFLTLFLCTNISIADQYPNTSIGIIDINKVLTESKAAVDAAKQIEKIQKKSEEESKKYMDPQDPLTHPTKKYNRRYLRINS